MINVIPLKKTTKQHLHLIGEKAYHLSILSQKLNVPAGFIITARAFQKVQQISEKKLAEFLNINQNSDRNLIIAEELQNEIQQCSLQEELKEQIKDAYSSLNIEEGVSLNELMENREDTLVVVRPAPIGYDVEKLHMPLFCIKGMKEIERAIFSILTSMYSPEALEYRMQHPNEKMELAIIIQRMVDTTASGILQTSYKMNAEEVLIFGCKGLGTALSSGLITPDRYFITKRTLSLAAVEIGKQPFMFERDIETNKIIKVYIQEEYGKKQKIPDRYLGELTLMSKDIEQLFGKPSEISFGVAKEMLYFFGAKEAAWFNDMQKTAIQKPTAKKIIIEPTEEEIEKTQQEISTHIKEQLEKDLLVANALNNISQREEIPMPVSVVSQEQPLPTPSYDPNDINSVVMSIDFNTLIHETEQLLDGQQKKQEIVSSVIVSQPTQMTAAVTESIKEAEDKEQKEESEEIAVSKANNNSQLTKLEKTAGELIIHCFKELKITVPKEQWGSSPELRHVAVLAQNYSQKNIPPTASQVKFAMDAVDRVKDIVDDKNEI